MELVVEMKRSSDLLIRVMGVINTISPGDEQLDDLARAIFLQIAEADANSRNLRVSDITSSNAATAPTIYGRLKNLVEMGLIWTKTDPQDGRVQLLCLTPMAQKSIKKAAKEIDRICRV